MNFNDLLNLAGVDPERVVVLRHTLSNSFSPSLLGQLADAHPAAFNLYQSIQRRRIAATISAAEPGYVASFIGHESAKTIFVGLYKVEGSASVVPEDLANMAEWKILADLGFTQQDLFGSQGDPSRMFNLQQLPALQRWSGKLLIDWPPPAISWCRRAYRNTMPVRAITEESNLAPPMVHWRELLVKWREIPMLPPSWRVALSHWRGIYFIHDHSDGKGYVGSAYGENNLMGRWDYYAQTGHGDVVGLQNRDPKNFTFSILERVAPETDIAKIVAIENSWKRRLHTYIPTGMNRRN